MDYLIAVSDTCSLELLWRMSPNEAMWLKESKISFLVSDIVKAELYGEGERKKYGATSPPGVRAYSLFKEWNLVRQFEIDFSMQFLWETFKRNIR